ncbi:hypothetical protein F2Q69_00063303 [Brassica cretica]|uniref:DUF4283 domain-containing protein n=1 Tax=Brassica cretica TaxID=69181 RepID=A0A8S9RHN2_BRACR|nr:hypothetical protein F2Q69_00063303 [Brassica cretica]
MDWFSLVVNRIWGTRCRIYTRQLGDSSFLFHIPDEVTRKWVTQRGIWHVDDCILFVSAWNPAGTLALLEITTIPVWLTLKNIPHQLYSKKGISWIASGIGAPMLTSKPWLDTEVNVPTPPRQSASIATETTHAVSSPKVVSKTSKAPSSETDCMSEKAQLTPNSGYNETSTSTTSVSHTVSAPLDFINAGSLSPSPAMDLKCETTLGDHGDKIKQAIR